MAKTRSKLTPDRKAFLASLHPTYAFGQVAGKSGMVEGSSLYIHTDDANPANNYVSVSGITAIQFSELHFPGYVQAEHNEDNQVGVFRKRITSQLGPFNRMADTDVHLADIDTAYAPYVAVTREVLDEHNAQPEDERIDFNPNNYAERFFEPAAEMNRDLMRAYLKHQLVVSYRQFYNAVKVRIAPWAANRFDQSMKAYERRAVA